ncbi:MAG: suppressor of fused domain protein [Gemmataceae bacterium]|nr:suppressor of fused domain protein [Gemmataceae bacterium]
MHNPWDRCYYEHFTTYFGKPFDLATYNPGEDLPPLRLLTHDQVYPRYRLYASLGLTAYAQEVKDLAEAILLADGAHDEVPFLFVNSLFFIARQRIPLTTPFAIGGVDRLAPNFAQQFDKSAIFFNVADGFGEGFEVVPCEGEEGHVYQGVFISEAEHDYLKRHGPDAFNEKYRAQGESADLCSLFRPSCV